MQLFRIILIISLLQLSFASKAGELDSLRAIADRAEIDTSTVLACYEIASALWYEDVTEAAVYAEKGLEIAESLDWKPGIAMMQRNIAAIASIRGDYATSLIANNSALHYYREVGDTTTVGKVYNNLAIIYSELGLEEKAIEYYHRSQAIFEELDNYDMLSTIYNNLGVVLQEKGETEAEYLDSALQNFQKSLVIARELRDSTLMSFNYTNMGYVYKVRKDYDSALYYFGKSKSLNTLRESDHMIANDHSSMAEVLIDKKEYEAARDLLQVSLPVVEGQELKPLALDMYRSLSVIYENTGEIAKALQYQKKYSELSDAMAAAENERVLLSLQAQQKDMEISNLDRENRTKAEALASEELKNNMFRVITIGLVISLFFALYQYWRRSVSNQKLAEQNLSIAEQRDRIEKQNEQLLATNKKLDELNKEINYLVKVVAHDLTAPLGRIKGLVELIGMEDNDLNEEQTGYMDKIRSSAERLEGLIKTILDNQAIESGRVNIEMKHQPVSEIMEQVVRNYQPIAAEKSIDITEDFSANGALANVDRNLTFQIFENLVSNAIKFSPRHTEVKISVVDTGAKIKAKVADMGPGLTDDDKKKLFGKFQQLSAKPTANETSYGLGLSIVKKLVGAMNAEVYCESSPGAGANFVVEFDKVS